MGKQTIGATDIDEAFRRQEQFEASLGNDPAIEAELEGRLTEGEDLRDILLDVDARFKKGEFADHLEHLTGSLAARLRGLGVTEEAIGRLDELTQAKYLTPSYLEMPVAQLVLQVARSALTIGLAANDLAEAKDDPA